MSKGLFFASDHQEKQLELPLKDTPIDEEIVSMEVGEQISFPISKKGSVTGRVSDLNKKFGGDKVWHTRTIKVEFSILVIRDK